MVMATRTRHSGQSLSINRRIVSLSVLALTYLVASSTPIHSAHAQVPREPDYEAMKNSDQDGENKKAADRLKDERKNDYRGGAKDFSEVKQKMEEQMAPILLGKGSDIDKWYSPYLRDVLIPPSERGDILPFRYQAGAPYIIPWWTLRTGWCVVCFNGEGTPKTACDICQFKLSGRRNAQGCFESQNWDDEHYTPTCCYKNTIAYKERFTDANFKACCVRKEDKNESTEEIACRTGTPHMKPGGIAGDGWSGIFEYYYPTTVIAWENSRATTMFADKTEVNKCTEKARKLMHGEKAESWVEKAIKKNLEVVDALEGSSG
ncbi:MAG: hypothetical protein RL326_1954, partial [Pseudomonadota bacterium]